MNLDAGLDPNWSADGLPRSYIGARRHGGGFSVFFLDLQSPPHPCRPAVGAPLWVEFPHRDPFPITKKFFVFLVNQFPMQDPG